MICVVFYHAGMGFPGGYVGVDVFFVISGYLITGLILKDLERGRFSLANFWERRVRRIFPALAVMVAGTMVAGWFLLLPDDLAKLGASVIAQSLMVSNFYFWRTTNYFGGANEEKPLLHTWSLAVEEQFYLILPIALMAIWAFFNYRLKKVGTTDYTDGHGSEAGLRLASQAGASELDLLANKFADSPVSDSPIRSADDPASALDSRLSTLDPRLRFACSRYQPPATRLIADWRYTPLDAVLDPRCSRSAELCAIHLGSEGAAVCDFLFAANPGMGITSRFDDRGPASGDRGSKFCSE